MDDYDNARAERDFRLNPPQSSPIDGDDWDSLPTGRSSLVVTIIMEILI